MGKLKNVTEADIKAAVERGDDFLSDLHEFINKLEKGYCDEIAAPAELARGLSNFATACSRMATLVLAKAAMQEQRRELDALLSERKRLEANQ